MALKFEDMLKLAKTVAKANPSAPTAYSFGDKTYRKQNTQTVLEAI